MAKAAKKALTKSAFLADLAERTELSKKQIDGVLDALVELVKKELSGKGAGKVVIPGLARMTVTKVKAVKGGVQKINPLTKTPYTTKDKPAYNKVRLSPIKALKEALK
ncbi:HU family DNA-binding protein [bacterium]|nr:HU family DNA-binding protein [bacterium]